MTFNESEEVVLDIEEAEEVEVVKATETDDAKLARLTRQKTQLEKKLGITEKKEEKEQGQPDSNLIEKSFLRSAGIVDKEEVADALRTAKKWGMTVDELVDDEDWVLKLEKSRTNKANALATTNVRGDKSGGGTAKDTTAYWIAKGTPPTAEGVTDSKTRRKIVREMLTNAKGTSRFYND